MSSKKWVRFRYVAAILALVGAVIMWGFQVAQPPSDLRSTAEHEMGNEVLLATNPPQQEVTREEVDLTQSSPTVGGPQVMDEETRETVDQVPFAREMLGQIQKKPEAMQLYGEIMEYLDSEEGETAAIDMIEALGEGGGEMDQAFLEKAIPNPAIRAKWNRLLELVIADQGLPIDEI